MSDPLVHIPNPPSRRRIWIAVVVTALATFGVMLLALNIVERKREARETHLRIVDLTEETVDPAQWGRNFPRQYDGYRRTVDIERTRHGGSDAFQKLDDSPVWRSLFAGYAFGVDYREERGHAYMLSDQDQTERVRQFKQPGACLHCHSSVIPAYVEAGRQAGATTRADQIMKGFEAVCAMPYADARKLVSHPVSCLDCHDPATQELRVTRPAFLIGIQALAASADPLPHLPSIARWRKEKPGKPYDPNGVASRQEMRSLVCAQCHVEYYFEGAGKRVTYPWANGLKADAIEDYYAGKGFTDWTHAISGAPMLKAQHPEFELWSQGIHARSGVSCADCHMPYHREGAIKVSDHHVRSPLLHVARSCQTCHRFPEEEIRSRAEAIQDRTRSMMAKAETAVAALIDAIQAAKKAGAADAALKEARDLHRTAQWRLDYVAAENSLGFHAPHETARLLLESVDAARRGELSAVRATPK